MTITKPIKGYIQINRDILQKLNLNQRGLLTAIMEHCYVIGHDENKRAVYRNPCTASTETLAKESKSSRPTVIKLEREMEELGVIYITRHKGKTNEIHIVDNPEAFLRDKERRDKEYAIEKESKRWKEKVLKQLESWKEEADPKELDRLKVHNGEMTKGAYREKYGESIHLGM